MNRQKYQSAMSKLLAKVMSIDVQNNSGSSLFESTLNQWNLNPSFPQILQPSNLVTCSFCKNGIIIGHSFSGTIGSFLYQTEKSKNNKIEKLFSSYIVLEKKNHLSAKVILPFINWKKTPILIV